MTFGTALVACVAGAAAGAWIAYLRWKDKHHPEPLHLLLATTAAGVISVGIAFGGFAVFDAVGLVTSWEALEGPWPKAFGTALQIGAIEELSKFLVVLPIAWWTTHFDEVWDGPVYAASAGVGFALAETMVFLSTGMMTPMEGIARAVGAPITHALFAAPMGLGLAHAVLFKRYWALALGLAASALCHGAYNLMLARPGMHIVAACIVGIVWVWLLFVGRELVKLPRFPRRR